MADLIHQRRELTPPHGDPIRLDVRRPSGTHPASAILVAHGFKGFKDWGFFPYLCERLAGAGHLVVSFNFSLGGVGRDLLTFSDLDAFSRNTFSRELDDLLWLLNEIAGGTFSDGDSLPGPHTPSKDHSASGVHLPKRFGLLGHSRGGGAAILGASLDDRVEALVTWAAVSSFDRWTEDHKREWERDGVTFTPNARTGQDMPLGRNLWDDFEANRARLDILAAASGRTPPWLIVHGAEDEAVPLEEAQALQQASGADLEILPDTGHTFGAKHPMESSTGSLEAAIERSLTHFQEHLV